jgi:hypothetical protein
VLDIVVGALALLVVQFGDWLRRRGGRIALIVALVVGIGLIARGVISAFP